MHSYICVHRLNVTLGAYNQKPANYEVIQVMTHAMVYVGPSVRTHGRTHARTHAPAQVILCADQMDAYVFARACTLAFANIHIGKHVFTECSACTTKQLSNQ